MNDNKLKFALLKIISEMVECPAGSFMMGSPKDEYGRNIYGEGNDFETQHKVAITQPFWIGKFLITEDQYETIIEEKPINYYDNRRYNKPASEITYQEAKEFCEKLNKLIERFHISEYFIPEDYHFDLPTEAQWEYACRAGTTRAFNSNDNLVCSYKEIDPFQHSSNQNLETPPLTVAEAIGRHLTEGVDFIAIDDEAIHPIRHCEPSLDGVAIHSTSHCEEQSDVAIQKNFTMNSQDNNGNISNSFISQALADGFTLADNSFLQEIAWYSGSMLTPDIVSLITKENKNYYEKDSFPKTFKDILNEEWVSYRSFKKPIGQLLPNYWGIFDMHGNVHEWVRDSFENKCDYNVGNAIDPIVSEKGKWHVLRGGSYKDSAEYCRSAARFFVEDGDDLFDSNGKHLSIGFRVALVSDLTYEDEVILNELDKEDHEYWESKKNNRIETLIQAIKNNKELETIKRLISESNLKELHSANKKIYYDGESPLTAAACCSNEPEIIKLLLDCGENTSYRNEEGYTALQCASLCNPNYEVFKILLENSKKEDFLEYSQREDENALGLALFQNTNINIIYELIKYDPSLYKDKDYYSRLLVRVTRERYYKASPGFESIVKLLIDKGADINKVYRKNDEDELKFYYALGEAIKDDSIEKVNILLKYGADPNLVIRDSQNKIISTPLFECIGEMGDYGNLEILKFLIKRNANIHQKLAYGRNIAMEAACSGSMEILRFLINYDKNLLNEEDDKGRAVLNYFIPYRWDKIDFDCLRFLIESGADVNHKDKYGEKLIAIAFYANCFKAIDILLEAGTIIDEEDFMIIKNRIRHCGLKASIRVKLIKRLYEIVGNPLV